MGLQYVLMTSLTRMHATLLWNMVPLRRISHDLGGRWRCRRKASPNPEVKAIIEHSRQQAGLMKAGISVKAFGPQVRSTCGTDTHWLSMSVNA